MTYEYIADAVQEILDPFIGVWEYPAAYPDVKSEDTPPKDASSPWAKVTVTHANGGQATLACVNGVSRWEHTGVIMIQILAPMGQGNSVPYQLAQVVANAYRKAKPPGGAWFRNQKIREVPGNDGPYSQINFSSEFQYDQMI